MPDSQTYNEKVLLLRTAEGDENAFAELINQYSSRLYTYIFRITGNQYESEELVQDIFVQLWQTREALVAVQNLGGFLYVLSRNRAANALKKTIRERHELNEWRQNSWLLDDDKGEEEHWQNLLELAIDELPPQQQKIWKMSRKRHMKYAEIATELGISKDAVNKSLQAAGKNITAFIKPRLTVLLILLVTILFFKK